MTSRQTEPNFRDTELLSAYLDDVLSPADRQKLEARLVAEPDLQKLLDNLRVTVALLRAAPTLPPPRNFTLDPVKYTRSAPWWTRAGVLRVAGALSTAAAMLLIVAGLALSTDMNPGTAPASDVGMGVAAQLTAATTATATILPESAAQGVPATTTETAEMSVMDAAVTATVVAASVITDTPDAGPANAAPPAVPLATMAPPATALMLATPMMLATAAPEVGGMAAAEPTSAAAESGAAIFSTPTEPPRLFAASTATAPSEAFAPSPKLPTMTDIAPGSRAGTMSEAVTPTSTAALPATATTTTAADVTAEAGVTAAAVNPTPPADDAIRRDAAPDPNLDPNLAPRVILVVGLALLIIGAVVFAIGFLQRRIG